MLIGNDMPVGADQKAGPRLSAGLFRLGRTGRCCRGRGHRLWKAHGKIPGRGDAKLLRLGHTIRQGRQQLRRLVELELEELSLRIGRHAARSSELGDQRGVIRHRHADQFIGDRHTVNVEWRLTIEGQGNREGLPGLERPVFVGESQAPPALVVDHDHKIDATEIVRACRAMRERTGLIVGVRPALPVSDIDGPVGPASFGTRTG